MECNAFGRTNNLELCVASHAVRVTCEPDAWSMSSVRVLFVDFGMQLEIKLSIRNSSVICAGRGAIGCNNEAFFQNVNFLQNLVRPPCNEVRTGFEMAYRLLHY